MRPRLLDLGYLLAALLLGPLYLVGRLFRRRPLASPYERLGLGPPVAGDPGGGPTVWVHGVSVGEVLAARGLVAALRAAPGRPSVVVTSTTVTGLATARRVFTDLTVLASPYDLSSCVRRFLDRVGPAVVVLMELELWPNTLDACRRRGVPVVVANARVSERSLLGYQRLARWWPGLFDGLWCGAQDAAHGDRFRRLGLSDRIEVTGNLKGDNVSWNPRRPEREALREGLGFPRDARVLVAGSTHPEEDLVVLEAARRLGDGDPRFRLVIAPRHPERVRRVAAAAAEAGFRVSLRQTQEPSDPDCLVVDTMGELPVLYQLADVAFVGGSLVPVGGHNLLEPASLGLPLVVGPHLHTVQVIADAFAAAGALFEVRDARTLEARVRRLLEDDQARALAERGCAEVIGRHRGATGRTISMVVRLLDIRDEAGAAPQESSHHV